MIAGGRKAVRSALFLACLAACRHNPILKAVRQRLVDAGKPKMLVAIAAARKLLTILNAILRDKQPWRPEKRLTANTVAEETAKRACRRVIQKAGAGRARWNVLRDAPSALPRTRPRGRAWEL